MLGCGLEDEFQLVVQPQNLGEAEVGVSYPLQEKAFLGTQQHSRGFLF